MSRGFSNPEIHDVTNISAQIIDLDAGAYIGLYLWQDDAPLLVHKGIPFGLPEIQIFGGPEMADKFKQLAKAVHAIFNGPPAGASVEEWEGPKEPTISEIPF